MRGERYKMGLYELGVVNERESENQRKSLSEWKKQELKEDYPKEMQISQNKTAKKKSVSMKRKALTGSNID